MRNQIIRINQTNYSRVIGKIWNSKFYKEVSKKKHLYEKLDAWGIDAEYFDSHVAKCELISILDKDENIVYEVEPRMYRMVGIYKHFPPHRAQIFLPRSFFTTRKPITKNQTNGSN